ncbi:MAG TPA: hypothetical protein VMJ35_10670 [Dongiaceae bacterium]|nr:hypothetical protein [Dongiaceae bacterium]
MRPGLRQQLERINARMAYLLDKTRAALRGEGKFTVDEIREIQTPIDEMQMLIGEVAAQRSFSPEIRQEVVRYRSCLRDLRETLDQVRAMLVAQCASMQSTRVQFDAVKQWISAFQQTR